MTTEMFLNWILLIIGGYLLGSVMFCRLICLAFWKTDICKVSDDGNPGAANAFWYCGKLAGAIGLVCDLLKGFLPVFIAIKFLDYNGLMFALTMLAPVLGHAFSIFHGFMGGKCIATIYGELFALFLTWVCPILIVVLGFCNVLFEFVIKLLPGNKRAFVMFSILILASIPVCIYANQLSILIGVVGISMVAMMKHLPIYATDDKKHKNIKKARLAK